jgi:hypothetical protein
MNKKDELKKEKQEQIVVELLDGEERDSLCDIPGCPYIIKYRITGRGLWLHLCEYHAEAEGFI